MPSESTFTTPATIEEAVRALAVDGGMAVGGGTAVALLLKNRLIADRRLVYLRRIPELAAIDRDGDGNLRIGAMTTLRELSRSELIRSTLPALAYAAAQVGNPRVRAVATIGGCMAHADPRQDVPPVLLALGAHLRVRNAAGRREVAVSDLYLGFMETVLGEDDLITEIVVPDRPGQRAAYRRYTPGSDDDYPTVSAAAAVTLGPDGRVLAARVALGSVGSTALLAGAAAQVLVGGRLDDAAIAEAAARAADSCDPQEDQRGSAAYKRAMVKVWTRRVIGECRG